MKTIINSKYSKEKLQEFEAILLKKRQHNFEQINSYKQQLRDIADNGKDENSMENTGYNTQIEQLMELIGRTTKYNQFVENALLRIKNNVFGVCAETGQLINEDRLRAVPTTTLSLEGKKIRESKK